MEETNMDYPEQQWIYIIPQDLFEDPEFTRKDIRVYARIKCLKYGLKTSYARFSEMTGIPVQSIKNSIPKLIKGGWLVNIDGDLFALTQQNTQVKVPKQTPPAQKAVPKQVPDGTQVGTEAPPNGTQMGTPNNTNTNTNNTSNREKDAASAAHTPEGFEDKKAETMKQQMKGATKYKDEKGRDRIRLKNGKINLVSFPSVFLTADEFTAVRDRYSDELGAQYGDDYLIYAAERLESWIAENPTAAGKKKSHKLILTGWCLKAAREEQLLRKREQRSKQYER